MVRQVLAHPPSNPRRMTKQEEKAINSHLLIPLHAETILHILTVAREYDNSIVQEAGTQDEFVLSNYHPRNRIAV
jgi:hypothetical protein